MGFTQPDTPPQEPPQMPQAGTPGAAPVPYGGPASALGPGTGAPMPEVSHGYAPGAGVLTGVTGANHVSEAPLAAPNPNPYVAGSPDPVYTCASPSPVCQDIVAGTVAGSVSQAEDRFLAHERTTYGQGSALGMPVPLPPSPLDPGVGTLGEALPSGGFYDPPRNYGG